MHVYVYVYVCVEISFILIYNPRISATAFAPGGFCGQEDETKSRRVRAHMASHRPPLSTHPLGADWAQGETVEVVPAPL